MLAIGSTVSVTLFSMIFLGSLLVLGGIVYIANAFKTRHGASFFLSLLAGIFYAVVGVMLIIHPAIGAITVTLLMAAFYTVTGLFKIFVSVFQRFAHWGWVFFSGIVSLLLGLLIWSEWPISGLWIIGLFIGIDLIIAGWIWIALSLNLKNYKPRIDKPRID